MSGIVGILNLDGSPVDRSLLARLTDYLTFRGPEAQETWSQGPVGLGRAWLRTAEDTRSDTQPLSLDGQVWIAADARIDGRAELRQQLSSRGCHDLEEAPDAELILHSYLIWGEKCVKHLLGDFAFAIWDGRQQRLFCARDHFGIKPFYYAQVGNRLVFSNTLDCVRLHPQVSDRLDDLAIGDFLLFEFNQDQSTTTFADIRRLAPAHYLTWHQGTLRLTRYWSLPLIDRPLRYSRPQDYVEHFKALLTQAVADRLRTRRVGAPMSGGLDSSTVAALARNLLSRQAVPFDLQSYTIVFDRLIPDEERHYSGLVARALNIPIHHLPGDDYRLYEGFESGDFLPPQPMHHPLLACWADLSRAAAGRCRVMLTGEAGDAILFPSPTYLLKMVKGFRLAQLTTELGRCLCHYGRVPRLGLRTGLRRRLSLDRGRSLYPVWLNPAFEAKAGLRDRWARRAGELEPPRLLREEIYQRLQSPAWQHSFENFYDPGATRLPLEFCHPCFDVRLINFALALPPLPWCVDKLLLREAGKDLLPEPIRRRPKTPLAGDPWLELIRRPETRWLDRFVPVPRLDEYVDRKAIPLLTCEVDPDTLSVNIRPVSLNYWLGQGHDGK
ncbi:MAG: asparagine synthetase B [Deltaproteobacteria bacterium]|nr:asparagine synthetase B [Deltaproteobacteria bacterium]